MVTERERIAALHDKIRQLILKHCQHESAEEIAIALMYEVASITGALAPSQREAEVAIRGFAEVACEQIAHYGVGKIHP